MPPTTRREVGRMSRGSSRCQGDDLCDAGEGKGAALGMMEVAGKFRTELQEFVHVQENLRAWGDCRRKSRATITAESCSRALRQRQGQRHACVAHSRLR